MLKYLICGMPATYSYVVMYVLSFLIPSDYHDYAASTTNAIGAICDCEENSSTATTAFRCESANGSN